MTPTLNDRARALLTAHAARYPAWCIIDAYKLLFQACMGPGHAVSEPTRVKRVLLAEWNRLTPNPDGDIAEDIGLHAPLWRLHLAAAKAQGLSPDVILKGFVHCARTFPQRSDLLAPLWALLRNETRSGGVQVADSTELVAVDHHLQTAGFPAVSHSAAYRRAYSPAYRLVGTSRPHEPAIHA